MNVIVKNNLDTILTISDLMGISITVSGSKDLSNYFKPYEIAKSNVLLEKIASSAVTINDGTRDFDVADAIRYVSLYKHVNPTSPDGKEIIRADTRPIGTQTYFTMVGDTVSGIGDGASLTWDFSNEDNLYDSSQIENGPTVASGYKAKRMDIWFNNPVYLKDGTLYFQNACFDCHVSMFVTVPAGNYYPNDAGSIPASALGLSGDQMYAYASKDVLYSCYVMKHHMMGDCTMGDELNAEGAQMDAIPAGWLVTGIIICPESCNDFRGFGSLELYRQHSVVLPGGAPGGE